MKQKKNSILDLCFEIFIFFSIISPATKIGKIIQVLSISMIILLCLKKSKFYIYNFIELLFVLYTYFQFFFDIVVLKESINTSHTILYNFFFIFGIINYFIIRNDKEKIIKKYAITTLFALTILLLFYNNTIISFRFSASNILKIGNVNFIGGNSSTSLSIIAAIPSFFMMYISDKSNLKKNIFYILILMFFSLITGTRKTLIIYIYIFLIMLPLKKNKVSLSTIFKILIRVLVVFILSFLIFIKVPTFYNIVGHRIEDAIDVIVNDDNSVDSSIRTRERMISQSQKLFEEKKWFGWGMDYYRISNQSKLNYYSHNNFYEILVGGGIVAFILYYLKYIYLFKLIIKYYKKSSYKKNAVFLGGFLVIMTILEKWQVVYLYRYIIIYQALIFGFLFLEIKNKNLEIQGEK